MIFLGLWSVLDLTPIWRIELFSHWLEFCGVLTVFYNVKKWMFLHDFY